LRHTFPKPTAPPSDSDRQQAVGLGNVNAARHARVDRCSSRCARTAAIRRSRDGKKKRDEGLRAPACFGNTCKLVRFQPSRLKKCRSSTLGSATEVRRSDKAKTVVRLHPERLLVLFSENCKVTRLHRKKQSHGHTRGRGVTVAQQTFNLRGVGSNPSGPTRIHTRI
jgi:hypothetical protein